MAIQEQQHNAQMVDALSTLQEELHQIDIETFEIEDLVANDVLPVASTSSCNTCFTTSCCSSSCSTV